MRGLWDFKPPLVRNFRREIDATTAKGKNANVKTKSHGVSSYSLKSPCTGYLRAFLLAAVGFSGMRVAVIVMNVKWNVMQICLILRTVSNRRKNTDFLIPSYFTLSDEI